MKYLLATLTVLAGISLGDDARFRGSTAGNHPRCARDL
jgi:hypothetical protein